MKIGEIVTALPVLQKLADEKLTLKTLYQLNHLMSMLETEIDFYNKERLKIVEELGRNVEGATWEVPKENMAEFTDRMGELTNFEVDAEIKPVKLPTSENIQMSYNDIKALSGFIDLDFTED